MLYTFNHKRACGGQNCPIHVVVSTKDHFEKCIVLRSCWLTGTSAIWSTKYRYGRWRRVLLVPFTNCCFVNANTIDCQRCDERGPRCHVSGLWRKFKAINEKEALKNQQLIFSWAAYALKLSFCEHRFFAIKFTAQSPNIKTLERESYSFNRERTELSDSVSIGTTVIMPFLAFSSPLDKSTLVGLRSSHFL